jgi:hypothetical protein
MQARLAAKRQEMDMPWPGNAFVPGISVHAPPCLFRF